MKFEIDNEMDALLRRHARREIDPHHSAAPSSRAAGDGFLDGAHLDADELSAFAENALPAPARARYIAHLATCDDCRKIATDITLANNVAGELEKSAAAVAPASQIIPASWRERLSSWLIPQGAWQYALPLVALLVVSSVVLLAMLRSDQETAEELAASREQSQGTAATQETNEGTSSAVAPAPRSEPEAKDGATSDAKARTASRPVASIAQNKETDKLSVTDDAVGGRTPAPSADSGASISNAPAIGDNTPAPSHVAPAEQVSVTQPEAPAKSVSEQQARTGESSRNAYGNATRSGTPQLNSESQSGSATQNRGVREMSDEAESPQRTRGEERAGVQAADEKRKARAPARRSAPAAKPAAKNEEKAAGAERKEKDDDVEEETRTIAGRRFRRQGGLWVDTAYRPAQATIIVRRGSEQFRALVADAPELRSIANAFGGEVIVVWQGRAYRIR